MRTIPWQRGSVPGGRRSRTARCSEGLIRSTFVVDENGELIEAYRNVRAKGHVDRIKSDLLA